MTYEQYWDGDASLPRDYVAADRIRRERRNEELWLQGMYIYEAICDAAPILRSFAKKGTRARPYVDHPYPLDKRDKEAVEQTEEKKVFDKGMAKMKAWMEAANKRKQKEVTANDGH